MKLRTLFIVAFSFLFTVHAQLQGLHGTIEMGDRYFNEGQIPEALFCYQRAAFFSPGGASPEVLLKIADCFSLQGDFDRSVEYLDHAYFSNPSDSLGKEIILKKANEFIISGNYNFALIELLGMDTNDRSHFDLRRSLYLGSSYYWLGDTEKSFDHFKIVVRDDPEALLRLSEIYGRKRNFTRPNPKTAMWLSVFIPGAGQIYSGDVTAGLNSLILTGSLVALTVYLTKTYNPIDALLTALPWFQRYYQGGFEQARTLAEHKLEKNRKETYHTILEVIRSSEKNQD